MPSRRHFLAASTATLVTLGAPALAQGGAARMRSVTAITQVFGDGIRLTAAAIEYTVAIDGAKLQGSAFQVAGRRITDAYTSTAADPAQRAQAGRFVILALSPEDADAILAEHVQPQRGAHSQAADAGGRWAGRPSAVRTRCTAAPACRWPRWPPFSPAMAASSCLMVKR